MEWLFRISRFSRSVQFNQHWLVFPSEGSVLKPCDTDTENLIQYLYLLISSLCSCELPLFQSWVSAACMPSCPLDGEEVQNWMSVTGDSVPYSSPPLSVHVMCQDSAHPAQPQAWFTWASSSNQTPDLDSLLEEACVRCFNLLKLMSAEGKETHHKAGKCRSFFCIPDMASSTDQAAAQYWFDRTFASVMSPNDFCTANKAKIWKPK